MSVFFSPPRSGGPLRATRTSEQYLTPGTAANEFYKKRLETVPVEMHEVFKDYALTLSGRTKGSAVDDNSRTKLSKMAVGLRQQQSAVNNRPVAGAHNAATLVTEIKNVVRFMYENDVEGDDEVKHILKYEMRDGLDPTNRIVLCCVLPGYCCGLDNKSLLDGYKRFDEPPFAMLKYALIVLLLLFYILCILWLSYGQQTLYACNQDQPSLANQGFTITDARSAKTLHCRDLLARCYLPAGRMPLETYYSVRVASYVLCTIPLLFLFASPCVLSSRLLAPLSDPKTIHRNTGAPSDPDNEDNVAAAEKCIDAIFCARGDIQVNDFFDISAYWMLLTHWAGGIFTLYLDISTIDYVGGLEGACKGWTNDNKNLIIDSMDDRCACSVLFGPAETRGLARVSALELMSPKSVAIVLMIANFVYTIWSIGFVLQVWQFRYQANRPPPKPKTSAARGDSKTDGSHVFISGGEEHEEEEEEGHPHGSRTNSMRGGGRRSSRGGGSRVIAVRSGHATDDDAHVYATAASAAALAGGFPTPIRHGGSA
jgi:hypothetical protein